MRCVFYIDEFEFYGGKAEPVKWEYDLRHGCVGTYHLTIGDRSCNAMVYVSKKGTRKALTLIDDATDKDGRRAVFDIFEKRVLQDGGAFQIPEYAHSIAFKRSIAKAVWLCLSLILLGMGCVMIITSIIKGAPLYHAVVGMGMLSLAAIFHTGRYKIEDMFIKQNEDYRFLKQQ